MKRAESALDTINRTEWFHQYSKSNITHRKIQLESICRENLKLTRRLMDIKPHKEIQMLKKECRDIVKIKPK